MSSQRFSEAEFRARHDLAGEHFDLLAALVKPKPGGPWLVGGCVRRHIAQMPQESDCDVAFANEEQLQALRSTMEASGFTKKRETTAHVELCGKVGKRPEQLIQLLRIGHLPSLEATLDSFDFTICQFGYDGTDLVAGQFSLWDLARRRLVLHKLTFGASTVRRMTKYAKQGFTFCQGTIVSILEAVVKDPSVVKAEVEYVD